MTDQQRVKGQRPPPTAGMRHVALFVSDFKAACFFYIELLGMAIEWQPDEDNIFLCSGSCPRRHVCFQLFFPTYDPKLRGSMAPSSFRSCNQEDSRLLAAPPCESSSLRVADWDLFRCGVPMQGVGRFASETSRRWRALVLRLCRLHFPLRRAQARR